MNYIEIVNNAGNMMVFCSSSSNVLVTISNCVKVYLEKYSADRLKISFIKGKRIGNTYISLIDMHTVDNG